MSTPLPPLVAPASDLSREELERYSRHLTLPQLGEEGQRRLKNARVLVIGAGGLGARPSCVRRSAVHSVVSAMSAPVSA